MLKALIMSHWIKDLVQKGKLDTAHGPHLQREQEGVQREVVWLL